MSTSLYDQLTDLQRREIRMFGATREQVDQAVDSYLAESRTVKAVVERMLMSAWREANWGELEDARQTLNRVKVTIQRFYSGPERGFFFEPEGQAYSILSDAQHLMEYDDVLRAKVCIDEANDLITQGGNLNG